MNTKKSIRLWWVSNSVHIDRPLQFEYRGEFRTTDFIKRHFKFYRVSDGGDVDPIPEALNLDAMASMFSTEKQAVAELTRIKRIRSKVQTMAGIENDD